MAADVQEVSNLAMYDSRNPYPSWFDEIDFSDCEDCDFECWIHDFCIKEQKD